MGDVTVSLTWNVTMADNVTVEPTRSPHLQRLHLIHQILTSVILMFIMFCMGCGTDIPTIKKELKRPVAPAIGAICQFIVMPALTFGLAHALRADMYLGIGLITVGSCPGGVLSNVFAYWSRANLELSVAMTTISVVLALGFMPLNLFIYSRSWTDNSAVIPYPTLIIGILIIWIPVIIGALIRRRWERVGEIIKKLGSVFGFLLVVGTGVIQQRAFPEVFDLPWTVWFAASTLPFIGFALGYTIAAITRQPWQNRSTIGYETALQNTGLALSMISVSYPANEAMRLLQFPLIYTALQIAAGVLLSIIHRCTFRIRQRKRGGHDLTKDADVQLEEDGGKQVDRIDQVDSKGTATNYAYETTENEELSTSSKKGGITNGVGAPIVKDDKPFNLSTAPSYVECRELKASEGK